MSATATAAQDRSDFRTVTVGGALVGLVTGVAVVLVVAASRNLAGDAVRGGVEALVVIAAAVVAAFFPAHWTAARGTEGIAGAAAVGWVGTVVFSAIDIVLLRPFKAYPWTWDAIGGGSTWWYLPVWWMLGTFLAWMGGIVTASQATRGGGQAALGRSALPAIAGAVIVAAIAQLAGAVSLPAAAGGAFTIVLTALALVALTRKG